jgi:hypothetical protein
VKKCTGAATKDTANKILWLGGSQVLFFGTGTGPKAALLNTGSECWDTGSAFTASAMGPAATRVHPATPGGVHGDMTWHCLHAANSADVQSARAIEA